MQSLMNKDRGEKMWKYDLILVFLNILPEYQESFES